MACYWIGSKPLPELNCWGQVMHICISKQTITGSDNSLSPGWCQAIIWTNSGILLIGLSGTNFSEILIGIHTFVFRKMHLKMSSRKWQSFFPASCVNVDQEPLLHGVSLGHNELMQLSLELDHGELANDNFYQTKISFKKVLLKIASARYEPSCSGLCVITLKASD